MKGSFRRLGRTFLTYSVKIISLLLPVSSFLFLTHNLLFIRQSYPNLQQVFTTVHNFG